MGLYDRAYATDDRVYRDRPQLSMIVKIVIVTGIVFLVDSLSVSEGGEHPIGNWLAQFGLGTPFYFWGSLGLMAAIVFLFLPKNSDG